MSGRHGSAAIAGAVLLAVTRFAAADALAAANVDRLRGCGGPQNPAPLRADAKLASAARRLAGGASLDDSLAAAGYIATQSSAMHVAGPADDAELAHALATNYCRTLTDSRLRDFGAERRGRDTWMVLAAPAPLPAAGDAGAIARHILLLVNQARAAGHRCGERYFPPAPPLALDPALTQAALVHSQDMASHNEFDHRGHDGSSPATRVEHAGFGEHRIVGENIAAGAMSAADVAHGWLDSPAHCENIMDPRFTHVGIGYAQNLRTASAVFWTQDFAAHR